MPREYKYLTPEQRAHFVEHGWLKIERAIQPKYIDAWTKDLWVRLGYDPKDKSTWKEEYLKLPRHREVPVSELCPDAWKAMVEIVGGSDVIDPVRERYHGDQFIINFGSDHWDTHPDPPPIECRGWHHDNDWYRQFLDSSGNALTIIHCFTDIPAGGGGTLLCEDGIKGMCEYLLAHPEGLDPPFPGDFYSHVVKCNKFAQVTAKAGDVLITHTYLPHTQGKNHLHYARVITNPHVNMIVPFNFNRPDGDHTLCEQVILHALGRQSIPEWAPTRERKVYFPRTATFKLARVQEELDRMIKAAGSKEAVDSVYLRGEEAIEEHKRRNGYDKGHGPGPIAYRPGD